MKDEYLEARPILELDSISEEFKVLLTAAALVMLLLVAACTNLGILVLARGVARQREIRVRMALGAGRLRVVRQLFTESLLLAMLSGLCALFLSTLFLKVMQLQQNSTASLVPDWRAVVATFGAALLSALVFGLPPAFRLASLVPRKGGARTIFLGAQVAVSCLLLVVSSLLVSSRQQLGAADPGFDYRNLVAISPNLRAHGYEGAAAQAYLEQLRERTATLPNVKGTSRVWLTPWNNLHMWANWMGRQYAGNQVDPQFLDTMGIRLVRGHNFRPGDDGVALVNEATARVLWPDLDALGKTLPWGPQHQTVIGVVSNASTVYVGQRDSLEFYLPPSPKDAPDSGLVRVSGSPRDVVRHLQTGAQPRRAPATDGAGGRGFVRPGNGKSHHGPRGDRDPGNRRQSALGHRVGRPRRLHRDATHARDRAPHRARSPPLPRCPRDSRPDEPADRHRFRLRCSRRGRCRRSPAQRHPDDVGLDIYDPLPYLMALALFASVVALSMLAPGRRATRIDPLRALQHE